MQHKRTAKRVIIVDDQRATAWALAESLTEDGYETVTAGSSEEALKLGLEDCDALITDLRLPGMNGIELMSAVHKARRTMPSILITAYGSNDVIASARKAGAVGCFSKPFKIEDIKQCLKKALEGSSGARVKARGRKSTTATGSSRRSAASGRRAHSVAPGHCAAGNTGRSGASVRPARADRSNREVELVERYLPLVKSAVDRIKYKLPKTIDEEDLTNSGVIGLIDAVRKFDSGKKTKFETYAMWRIKGAILDELRALDWASRSARRKARDIQRQLQKLEQKLGRSVSDGEVADSLKISSKDMSKIGETVRGRVVLSIDQPVHLNDESGHVELSEVIEDTQAVNMLDAVEQEESKKMILQCVNNLPEQERLVIALYYYEELTLKQIGQVLGISESRASQVHTKAVSRLKNRVSRVLV